MLRSTKNIKYKNIQMGAKCWSEEGRNLEFNGEFNIMKYKNKKRVKSARPKTKGVSISEERHNEYVVDDDENKRVCQSS